MVNEDARTISLDIDSMLEEDVSIFDMFPEVEVVCLDNSFPLSNTVYSGVSRIACDGTYIYIMDEKNLAINVYDEKGRLVSRYDKKGRGPGEFTMAYQTSLRTGWKF